MVYQNRAEMLGALNEQRLHIEELKRQRDQAEEALVDLKKRVGKTALELTQEHGWCDVVKEALEELGIEMEQSTLQVTVVYTIKAAQTSTAVPTAEFVANSLMNLSSEIALDEDWTFDEDTIDYDVVKVVLDGKELD